MRCITIQLTCLLFFLIGLSKANLCEISNGGCNQLCSTIDQQVTCSCFPGFQLSEDGKTCLDINECKVGNNPCMEQQKQCINTIGSYSCQNYDCESSEPGSLNYYKSDKCCKPKNGKCGLTSNIRKNMVESMKDPKTFGQIDFTSSAWPWMVQIVVNGRVTCGGSLLTDEWVVTTASCLRSSSTNNIKVHLGNTRNPLIIFPEHTKRVQRGAAETIIHSLPEVNDIGLIKLSEAVTFDRTISSICLPCGEQPKDGDKCWTTGFGTNGNDDAAAFLSKVLKEVDLPIVGSDQCSQAYPNLFNRDTMMCAGNQDGSKDTCLGDVGSPLVCQRKDSCEWYLSGITSFGKGCGKPGFYGVYTKITQFESWIRHSLGEDAKKLCGGVIDSTPICADTPGAEKSCDALRNQCDHPRLQFHLKTFCKKTCNFC